MKNVLMICSVLLLASCASHSLNYHAPTERDASTSKIVNKPFKKVWEKVVEGLAQKNFVIDSVNKDSGLIVVSRKLNPPSLYADCGKWDGHFKNMRVDEKYNFQGADSANYMMKNGDAYTAINRASSLNSKSNIFVKKLDEKKTNIQVNSQYNLRFDLKMTTYVYPQGQVYGRDNLTMDWTSQEKGRFGGNNKTECVSNFALEDSILELAI